MKEIKLFMGKNRSKIVVSSRKHEIWILDFRFFSRDFFADFRFSNPIFELSPAQTSVWLGLLSVWWKKKRKERKKERKKEKNTHCRMRITANEGGGGPRSRKEHRIVRQRRNRGCSWFSRPNLQPTGNPRWRGLRKKSRRHNLYRNSWTFTYAHSKVLQTCFPRHTPKNKITSILKNHVSKLADLQRTCFL